MLAYALSTIALAVTAVAAVGGVAVSATSAANQKRAGRRGEKRQKELQSRQQDEAASNAREQRVAANRQNSLEPDIAAMVAAAEKPSGVSNTFTSGQTGKTGPSGQIGRNTLLGQ
jgi:hypothetical protein